MIEIIKYPLVLSLTVVALIGCNNRETPAPQKEELPERIDTLENLTVFSPDEQTPDTVELVREQVFESNEEVYIQGYTGDVAVDNQNRVYVKGFIPGTAGIYVFEPDGSYITTIGRHGKGPGEFLTIAGMKIRGDQLYVYDNHQRRISIFSLDDFSLSRDLLIKTDKVEDDRELAETRPSGNTFHIRNDGTFLLEFKRNILSNDHRRIFYYRLSEDAQIIPGKILELQRYRFYIPENFRTSNGIRMPFTMPFTRSSLIAISEDDSIYTARTEDFLIKKYDKEGNYRRSFYYPYNKIELSLSDLEINNIRQRTLDNSEVPDTWPAIHTMEVDDKNRLWVSTITDSDSTFQWWVLDQEGRLLARFTLPGERSSRSIMSKPMYVIKNGYFYTRERDIPAGIDRIIKHKIVFRER